MPHNLFASFKRQLSKKKHHKEQDPQILGYYRKAIISKLIRYAIICGTIIFVIFVLRFALTVSEKKSKNLVVTEFELTQDANVRQEPSTDSNIIRVVKKGSKITGSVNGKWIAIKDKNETHYVSKSLTKPYESNFAVIGNVLIAIIAVIFKIPKFLSNLYEASFGWRIFFTIIFVIVIFKIYKRLANDKYKIIQSTLNQICDSCGVFGFIKINRELIDSKTEQRTEIEYVNTTSDIKNGRGETIATQEHSTPISRIVNVHKDTYRTNYFCKKCGNTSYSISTETWRS